MTPTPSDVSARRAEAGILLDFDGSLSEIVPVPEEAHPVDGAVDVLTALARSFRIVAVISGRRAADVAARIGPGVRCFGLYGREDERGPIAGAAPHPDLGSIREAVEAAAAAVPGAVVESKGPHLAVHYRLADDPDAAAEEVRARLTPVAAQHGLRLLDGRRVVELAPAGGPTKGDVVRRLAEEEGLEAVLYAGDDIADAEAFAAVGELASRGVVGVRVAVRSGETPAELIAGADTVVDGPAGLVQLLRDLV
jgi:trehalose 6-phosphate phosphatase